MGFNIEQYEMGGENYSNASGCGLKHPFNKTKRAECEKNAVSTEKITSDTALSKGVACIKGLPVYSPPVYLLTSKDKRTENRMICKARKEAKIKDDVVPSNAVQDNPLSNSQAPTGADTGSTSSTGMYVGIGVGILAIGIVAIVLIKRRKK